MPKAKLHTLAVIVLSMLIAAGCASDPSYEDDATSQRRCPSNYTLKCTKRSAQPEKCSCVTNGNIEETVEALIGFGVP
jgi:PBP1b-binding outer membrane lipoprotein LpoB